jgi:ribosome-associated protein
MQITPTINIPDSELAFSFIRASGPGGQNVNKLSTAVQMRFDVRGSTSLPAEVKERLSKLAGARMTQDGELVIEAKRYRSQERNRLDAVQRLVVLVEKAVHRPSIRYATRPSLVARGKRVESKKKRGIVKKQRHSLDE